MEHGNVRTWEWLRLHTSILPRPYKVGVSHAGLPFFLLGGLIQLGYG
ncbi:hypothetical protein Lalb_Chr18g0047111 [Lupinus albus]|uniref:Uncharacterized protein n=1 Tax=Lupinus albus TaxID=3870 RepID=A0A6A4P2M5_LUPAL|nr:hypothetical protein Lalb_Chr18g0047111 [Lupinus albus]